MRVTIAPSRGSILRIKLPIQWVSSWLHQIPTSFQPTLCTRVFHRRLGRRIQWRSAKPRSRALLYNSTMQIRAFMRSRSLCAMYFPNSRLKRRKLPRVQGRCWNSKQLMNDLRYASLRGSQRRLSPP